MIDTDLSMNKHNNFKYHNKLGIKRFFSQDFIVYKKADTVLNCVSLK